MSNQRHLPPAAGGPEPDPSLAERSCPGCGARGVLRQLVAPVEGSGRRPQEVALTARPAVLECTACDWTDVDRPTPGVVVVPGVDVLHTGRGGETLATRDTAVSREVWECFHDVPEHEPGGGGGNGKPPRDKASRGERRPDQDPAPVIPDKVKRSTEHVGPRRTEVIHTRVSPTDKALAQGLAASHNTEVSGLMLWGLQLVDSFPPGAWRAMEHEAQQRGLPNSTALLSHGFTEWWRLNVREQLG